jgi:hypothetical protein
LSESGNSARRQKRAYLLADNKIALNAGWDEERLALELQELMSADEFSVDATGFSIAEVDQLVEWLAPEEPGEPADDALSDLSEVPTRCRLGDIWRTGRPHRLVSGDALDPKIVSMLMEGEKAEMVFTDPPYNVAIASNVNGLGKIQHREFTMASGEMTRASSSLFYPQHSQILSLTHYVKS